MSGKFVLLTTDTPHHLYFAWKVSGRFPLTGILIETNVLKTPPEASHPIEKQQQDFEKITLLGTSSKRFRDLSETHEVPTCNDALGLSYLERWKPDWLLVFGTSLLSPAVLTAAGKGSLNLHGGDPEYYRGLDSHYWSIYNDDFDHLVTTLQMMDERFDTGDIVSQERLTLKRTMELFQLRALNTQCCVNLCLGALEQILQNRSPNARRQKMKGRYYSFMPAALKDMCIQKFRHHVATL